MSESIQNKQRLLNDQFFRESDQMLLDRLREEMRTEERKEVIAKATGIDDEVLIKELVEMGIAPDSLAVLKLVPMVLVAWADKAMEPGERKAILQAAAANGIAPESPAHELLAKWLEREPPPELETTWKDYTAEICKKLSSGGIDKLREETISAAERVAHAAGGVLGLGSVSQQESDKLDQLRAAFNR